MLCATLSPTLRNEVLFDVNNFEHMKAFDMLCLQPIAKQHPTLRFVLELPFTTVPQMMMHKIAQHIVVNAAREIA